MIPITLRLRNFMSYGDPSAELDFTAFQIACLCGENGHGKSAILDAITWALWGKSRARSEDDLLQIGKTDMDVEFTFALGSEQYRVIRKRARRLSGRKWTSTPLIEFQIGDGSTFRALTGDSTSATQAAISHLLRMDYDTFINSAFILQGHADEFTIKSASDRKQVLTRLLGLERYDELEKRARDESRARLAEHQQHFLAISELDRELAKRDEFVQQQREAEQATELASQRQLAANAELERWRAEQRAAQQTADLVRQLRARKTEAERDATGLSRRVSEDRATVQRLELLLTRVVEVATQFKRLVECRNRDHVLAEAATRLLELNAQQASLQQVISREKAQLESDLRLARSEMARFESLMRDARSAATQLAAAEKGLAELKPLEGKRNQRRQRMQECDTHIHALTADNTRLRAEMDDRKNRIAILPAGGGGSCPVCASPLNEASRAALVAGYQAEGKSRADTFRINRARVEQLTRERGEAEQDTQQLEIRLGARESLANQAAMARKIGADAVLVEAALVESREKVSILEKELRDEAYASTERADLGIVAKQIDALGYSIGEHGRIRDEIRRLESVTALQAQIETAQADIPRVTAHLLETQELLVARQAVILETTTQLAAVERNSAEPDEIQRHLQVASTDLDRAITVAQRANQELGRTNQLLSSLASLDQQRTARASDLARIADEKLIYDELALAFGKKGIQAMIIEAAIPEIEAEANELLQRLTDGQLHLTFETQRESKSGDGVIETLDIRIADSYGTRNYEMYSGGEGFRINFAIRIALSRLLARRAGAQLQFLVIDEGFGTQDALGRERLVESISAVASDFEKILVVTHIQELKDAFPVRIDVIKGAEGSRIAAVTVLDG